MFQSTMDLILDILLPSTDLGVLVQLVGVIVIFGLVLWRLWPHPDARLLATGLGLVVLGLMGFRALH